MTESLTMESPVLVASALDAESEHATEPEGPVATGTTVGRRGHSQTLDVLRGLAALGVVALHADGLMVRFGLPIPAYRAGETGVQLFFVLSGFLIGSSALAPERFGRRSYVVSRSARILPNYFVAIAIVLLLVDATPLFSTHGLLDVGSHLLMLHSMFKDFRTSIDGVYWTLGIEWTFYIFVFLVAGALRRRWGGWCIVAAMIGGSLLYKAVVWHLHPQQAVELNFLYKQFPGTADEFGVGLAVALLVRNERARDWAHRARVRSTGLLLSVIALVVLALVFNRLSAEATYHQYALVYVFWPLAFCTAAAGLILFFQQFETEIGPWLHRSRLPMIGVVSYSIYLFHGFVIRTFSASWPGPKSSVPGVVFAVAFLAAVLGVAAGAYLLVEKPFIALGRRYSRRSSRTVSPAR